MTVIISSSNIIEFKSISSALSVSSLLFLQFFVSGVWENLKKVIKLNMFTSIFNVLDYFYLSTKSEGYTLIIAKYLTLTQRYSQNLTELI